MTNPSGDGENFVFTFVHIDSEPILHGNEVDERILDDISPLVIFPCGAIEKDGKFVVSFGLNDEKTGIIKIWMIR